MSNHSNLYENPVILFLLLFVVVCLGMAYILMFAIFMSLGMWYVGIPMAALLAAGLGTFLIRSY